MVKKSIKNFNLKKIMESGQIFRMYERLPGSFEVFSADRRLLVEQRGDEVCFLCTSGEFEEYWKKYFDLDRDYGAIVSRAEAECGLKAGRGAVFLREACRYSGDIRILNQDTWEMMISFIISQQKQIPSIRKCVEALCERFGNRHEEDNTVWYGFPKASAIAGAGPDGLNGLKLGYRERYIYETSVRYLTEGISDEALANMKPEDAKKYLCSFTGIGEKVADCVLLFGAGFTDAFPIDVHIKEILYREFLSDKEKKETEEKLSAGSGSNPTSAKKAAESISYKKYMELIDAEFAAYKGVKGIVQQWIFAYEIASGKNF